MTASLDLDFDEQQRAIHAAVQRFCEQADAEALSRDAATVIDRASWQQLAQLGVFTGALPNTQNSSSARNLCAIAEALGEHAFPGPVGATCLAAQILPPDMAREVVGGRLVVSLQPRGSQLLPYGTVADIFLMHTGDRISQAQPVDTVETIDTLGNTPWGKARLSAVDTCAEPTRGLLFMHTVNAAYLTALALALLRITAEHAATRKQFGQALGDFQAVSHPLADRAVDLTAAQSLARTAACHVDKRTSHTAESDSDAMAWASAALHCAASASQQCAFDCHQVFGALGVTVEGPVFHRTRRIRQLLSESVDHATLLPPLVTASGLEKLKND